MNTSLSIFAKALASENLSFSFDPEAETASFDTKNRHLVMPVWNVSENVQTMLIAHEISHALWTPYKESDALLKQAESEGFHIALLQRIANVIEDVRIEKMMKEKYPGTRRDFFLGYKEIVDKDMFNFSKMDMEKQNILNKLNLHFKWGVPGFLDVPMTDCEMEIANLVDGVTTFPEVIAVAKALYKHPEVQKMVQQYEKHLADGNGDSAEKMLREAVDDQDSIGRKDGEKYVASSITFSPLKSLKDGIISTKDLLKNFMQPLAKGVPPHRLDKTEYLKFASESDAFVRQLASQFDRRKAADEIRRERPKQTGLLNMDKLHQYRTHDDIFISKIVKQDGKNHGIVFLLDMSGSMAHSIKDCFLQILQLVWFCEKVKIPFEVFGFTDVHPCYCKDVGAFDGIPAMQHDCLTAVQVGHARLINFASSRDDAEMRETLLAYLYECCVTRNHPRPGLMQMSSTPTVEAVHIASQFMVEWVKQHNIQIPTLMVVTDGNPNGVSVKNDGSIEGHPPVMHYYHNGEGSLTVLNEVLGTADRLNLGDYKHLCIGNMVLSTMFNSLRKTLNARCIGMFVGSNKLTESDFVRYCASTKEQEVVYKKGSTFFLNKSPRYAAAYESYEDGAIIVHPTLFPGYDSFFLVRTPKIVNDKDASTTVGNFTKVKNAFVRTMGKRGTSRVFLSRYVDIVAGQPVKSMMDKIYNHPL